MPEIKIYLVDYTGSRNFTTGKKSLLANRLKSLFDSVISAHTDYTVSVVWEYPSSPQHTDLVCYYVLSPRRSLIKAKFGYGPESDGYTFLRDGSNGHEAISEVYFQPSADFPASLADLAFHEFMHNKLDRKGMIYEVHEDNSGFGQSSLNDSDSGIATDDPSTPQDERLILDYSLTADNITRMYDALTTEVQQILVRRREYDRLMR